MLSYDTSSNCLYNGTQPSLPSSRTTTLAPASSLLKTPSPPQHRHLFIVYGPAGCGKSTVGESIAQDFGLPYIEGDSYHTSEAIKKMADSIPLNDGDRWDWLIRLREQAVQEFANGESGVVLTCSALKQKYRDVIRVISLNDHNVLVHFIYLKVAPQVLLARVRARQNHFMKDSMVRSQLDSLEQPDIKETDVLSIDVSGSIPEVNRTAANMVSRIIAQDS